MFPRLCGSVLALAAVTSASDCTGIKAISPQCATNESLYSRDVFFIGGGYTSPANDSFYSDQIYVEKLTPAGGVDKPHPLVFIAAGIPSGTVWLNTPDNRKGWASWFLDQGYQVYILDIAANGRSGQNDIKRYPLLSVATVVTHENGFTAPEILNPYPQSQGHDQWPGSGARGDRVFDAFFAQTVPLSSNSTAVELSMRAAGCELLSLIGPSYLISHSAGGTYSALMSDECPESVKANLNLEPGNVPFQSLIGNATIPAVGRTRSRPYGLTNTPITYDPALVNATDLVAVEVGEDTPSLRSCFLQGSTTVRTLPQIAKVPYVLFTAANSPHISYDHCFVLYLKQAGVSDVTWVKFGDLGSRKRPLLLPRAEQS